MSVLGNGFQGRRCSDVASQVGARMRIDRLEAGIDIDVDAVKRNLKSRMIIVS